MNYRWRAVIAVLVCGVWVSASEFVRNELLFKSHWVDHYDELGLIFPSEPVNGALWVAWSFLFSIAIFIISRRFSLVGAALLSWFMAFLMMWVVLYNLDVLPTSLLVFAVPLSLLEAFVGALICIRLAANE